MTEGTLADLHPDPKNARRRTPRSLGMIVDSLHQVGAARSIVVDEQNNILCGNGTVDAAGEAGIERVRFVDADGEEIIAVRRSGLTPDQKKKLALFDNRTAELAEWDADVLKDLAGELDLDDLWYGNEFAMLVGDIQTPDDPREHWDGDALADGLEACRAVNVYFKTPEDVEAFFALIEQSYTDNTKSVWFPPKKDD